MKKEFILVISLVALIALSGCTRSVCGNGTCERDETTANCAVDCGPIISSLGSLEVTVVSGFIGGTHLSGAQVVVTGYDTNVVTNRNGIALFEGLLPGTYHITASKEGYLSADVNATVMEGQVTNVRIKLPLHIPGWNCGDGNCTYPEDANNCPTDCGSYVWSSLGDKGTNIYSLAVYDGNLFTGDWTGILGTYNSVSNVWSNLGDKGTSIKELASYDGNLFTGHWTSGILGTYNSTSNVWSSLRDTGNGILALAVYDGNLYTGDIDGILGTYNSISNVWSSLGDKGDSIYSLAVYDGNLFTGHPYVLGTYNSTSNVWTSLSYVLSNPYFLQSLTVYDGNLFTGHDTGVLGTYNSTSNKWKNLGDKGGAILDLAVYDGNLFTGDWDNGILGTYNSTSNVWSSLVDIGSGIESFSVYDRKLFTGQYSGNLGVYYKR